MRILALLSSDDAVGFRPMANSSSSEDGADQPDEERNQWHRILTTVLGCEVARFSFRLESEVDVSIPQILDATVSALERSDEIKATSGENSRELPDGLTELRDYNLVTIKIEETLDIGALKELISYEVLYRKTFARSEKKKNAWKKLPDKKLGLYAISAKQPSTPEMKKILKPTEQPGVFTVDLLGEEDAITVIVPWKTRRIPRNALWHLVSLHPDQMKFGAENFDWNFPSGGVIYNSIADYLNKQGIKMATLEDNITALARSNTESYLKEHPEYLKEHPEYLKENPEILKENPEILKENPEILKENPEILKENPDILKENPEILKENPEILKENPEILKENPEILKENPEIFKENPDIVLDYLKSLSDEERAALIASIQE